MKILIQMVLLTIVIFAAVDIALRLVMRRMEQLKVRRERQQALDAGLKLKFSDQPKSLKRIEVPDAPARILAVDEPDVLDSFRKILVLAGYSVDTVESGEEALSLVRSADYDFVFTDLKLPGIDGLEVVKGVKHLRPDIDIVVITGHGSIETAVESMRFGAVDYVQKPFAEDAMVQFVKKLLIQRQERHEQQRPLEVRLVTPSSCLLASSQVINVPGGVYVTPEHTWVSIEMTGEARIGLDDFFQKTVGAVDEIVLPEAGRALHRGDPLFTLQQGAHTLPFSSPLSGRVVQVNHDLDFHLDLMRLRPYEQGWICTIEPNSLASDLALMTIGADSKSSYQADVHCYCERVASGERAAQAFTACYLGPQPEGSALEKGPEEGGTT